MTAVMSAVDNFLFSVPAAGNSNSPYHGDGGGPRKKEFLDSQYNIDNPPRSAGRNTGPNEPTTDKNNSQNKVTSQTKSPKSSGNNIERPADDTASAQDYDRPSQQKRPITSSAAEQPNLVQIWLANFTVAQKTGQNFIERPQPQAGRPLAQILSQSKPGSGVSPATGTPKPADPAADLTTTGIPAGSRAGLMNRLANVTGQINTQAGQQIQRFGANKPLGTTEALVTENMRTQQVPQGQSAKGSGLSVQAGKNTAGVSATDNPAQVSTAAKADPNGEQVAIATGQNTTPAKPGSANLDIMEVPGYNKGPGLSSEKARNPRTSGGVFADGQARGIKEPLRAGQDGPARLQLHTTDAREPQANTSQTNQPDQSELSQPTIQQQPQPGIWQVSQEGSAGPAKTEQSMPQNQTSNVAEQILESIGTNLQQNPGNHQITVRLNPPELGKVAISFRQEQDQVIGLLEVSKTQTRDEIQQALPDIIKTIQDAGVNLKRLEVQFTDQSQEQPFRDQQLHDGPGQEQNNFSHSPQSQGAAILSGAEDNSIDRASGPQLIAAGSSIDLLL